MSWRTAWKTNLNSEGLEFCIDAIRTCVLEGASDGQFSIFVQMVSMYVGLVFFSGIVHLCFVSFLLQTG